MEKEKKEQDTIVYDIFLVHLGSTSLGLAGYVTYSDKVSEKHRNEVYKALAVINGASLAVGGAIAAKKRIDEKRMREYWHGRGKNGK